MSARVPGAALAVALALAGAGAGAAPMVGLDMDPSTLGTLGAVEPAVTVTGGETFSIVVAAWDDGAPITPVDISGVTASLSVLPPGLALAGARAGGFAGALPLPKDADPPVLDTDPVIAPGTALVGFGGFFGYLDATPTPVTAPLPVATGPGGAIADLLSFELVAGPVAAPVTAGLSATVILNGALGPVVVTGDVTVVPAAAPEPATLALLLPAIGLLGVGALRRRGRAAR